MTILRKDPYAISNFFHTIEDGIGKRGSSFTDIDGVSHDQDTKRFLFREFKQPTEPLHPAQRKVLRDLAGLPRCTVWFLRRIDETSIGFGHFGSGRCEERVSIEEYRRRLACWWANEDYRLCAPSFTAVEVADAPNDAPLTAADFRWS